jgi:hypothetical protein
MFLFKPEFRRKAGVRAAMTLLSLLIFTALCMSCDNPDGPEPPDEPVYDTAAAKVDYAGANRAVFFDFSTGTITELAHDFFDIAIDAGGSIIANSGSYGSGVQVYKTESSAIGDDFSSDPGADAVREYTFRNGVNLYNYQQTEENPIAGLGMVPSNVYLIKVQYGSAAAEYFKVQFAMKMPGAGGYSGPPAYVVTAVPGLGAGETDKVELSSPVTGLTDGYGWLYFKLVGEGGPRVLNTATSWTAGGTAVPQATDWDLLFTRTIELQTEDGTTVSAGMPVASRSSVLLNTYKEVEAAAVAQSMEQVVNTTGLTFSGEVDAIGYGWYAMAGMPPTFSVPTKTFVVKTAEGHYAKFQPGTFYGPNSESFYMTFRYFYSGNATGVFDK